MTKQFGDFISVEKVSFWRRDAFDRDRGDLLGDGQALWKASGQKLEETVQ